jgi:hypothetical protein
LLAKPTQLNINLSSDRFAMFNKERDISWNLQEAPSRMTSGFSGTTPGNPGDARSSADPKRPKGQKQ